MNRILITGADSFIGDSFKRFMDETDSSEYRVDLVGLIDTDWKQQSFRGYDSVFHVSGLVHQKETKDNESLFYKINRDLAVEVAKKAKMEGVGHFVFLSTMSVYGMDIGIIHSDTAPNPKTYYGKSKLEAERILTDLEDDTFKISILRLPMVYGKGCKGNFPKMVRLVKKYAIFPKIDNQRSLIYIENLCSFIKYIIDEKASGIFFPQNREYMNTMDMIKWIGEGFGKEIHFSRFFGLLIQMSFPLTGITRKAFGTLIYEDMDNTDFDYYVTDSESSVKRSI